MRAVRLGRKGIHREQLIEQCRVLLKTEVPQMGMEFARSQEQITLPVRMSSGFKGELRLAGEGLTTIEYQEIGDGAGIS